MATLGTAIVGNHFAKCAIETALLDAMGQRLVVPVSELLGGRRRDKLPVAWTLASGNTAQDIAEAEHMLDIRRHNIFKLKIGKRSVEDDIAHVAAIKRAVGDRAIVRVDVNQAWDEASAARGVAMLKDAGCDLVEQPVAAHARTAMARLAQASTLPIMADEALTGPIARSIMPLRQPPTCSRSRSSRREASTPPARSAPSFDPSTPPSHGDALVKAIAGARLCMLEAAHLSNIEAPEPFGDAVLDFLTD